MLVGNRIFPYTGHVESEKMEVLFMTDCFRDSYCLHSVVNLCINSHPLQKDISLKKTEN